MDIAARLAEYESLGFEDRVLLDPPPVILNRCKCGRKLPDIQLSWGDVRTTLDKGQDWPSEIITSGCDKCEPPDDEN